MHGRRGGCIQASGLTCIVPCVHGVHAQTCPEHESVLGYLCWGCGATLECLGHSLGAVPSKPRLWPGAARLSAIALLAGEGRTQQAGKRATCTQLMHGPCEANAGSRLAEFGTRHL